jgi:hypothetical protein
MSMKYSRDTIGDRTHLNKLLYFMTTFIDVSIARTKNVHRILLGKFFFKAIS